LASRYRRKIFLPKQHQSDILFERHKTLIQPLINFIASRGRLPDDTELEDIGALREVFGSIRRAFDIVQGVTGKEQWDAIQKERTQDLLVYLALERFNGRPLFSALPRELQRDIKAFFGTYTHACNIADELLFSAGNMETINTVCKEAPCGKLTHEALYVHISGLPQLPPLLRVYEGCARAYIGAVEGTSIIKLSRYAPHSHSAPFLRQYMEFCCSNMLLYLHMRIAYALPHPFQRSQEEKEDGRHEGRNSITV
jgi:DNA phosphorothioation-associated putative methyltransferase